MTDARLPTPSILLEPPPPYDSLFATAAPPDSTEAPQISQITGATLIYWIQMLGWTGTCSSSPPVHLHTLTFTLYFFNSPAQTSIKNKKKIKKKKTNNGTLKKTLFL